MVRRKGRPEVIPVNRKGPATDWNSVLAGLSGARTTLELGANRNVYRQGEPADSVFYLREGRVKLSVTSQQGKEAIIAVLGADEFFGEGCLAGQLVRMSAAVAITDCTLARIEKPVMARILREEQAISELFVTHLLARNLRYQEDLIDQLFNSSEKRLARILIHLAHFGKESRAESILPGINQENLAEMVGTTRSRVSHFMNKFREMGFVDYTGQGGVTVRSGLLSVILHD
jgi:CRP/FNR family transcriptional regulator, cyclic AMP receptor protein